MPALFLIWGKTSFFPKIWPLGQAAKTSPSHGENRGSIPLSTAEKLLVIQELFVLSYCGEMEETGMD